MKTTDNRKMTNRLLSYGLASLLILSILGAGYVGVQALTKNPCAVPKTWSLGPIDSRFGISPETIKLYASKAADTWNKAYSANELLSYKKESGDIKITFVYDERQRTTIQNEKLKALIESEKEELDDLKRTIESLQSEYTTLEKTITTKTKAYTEHLASHNSEVSYWNSQGGAPVDEYQKLQREEATLETERTSLNANINRFNKLSQLIKNYGHDHNEVVDTLNGKIQTLNQTVLRDFEEGTYDPNTHTITIYEYANATALKRVLTHELGHSLGLKHVDEKNSIMYSVNQGDNLNLTDADKEELGRVCHEKQAGEVLAALATTRDDIFHLVLSSLPDKAAPAK